MFQYKNGGIYDNEGRPYAMFSYVSGNNKEELGKKLAVWLTKEWEDRNKELDAVTYSYKQAAKGDLDDDDLTESASSLPIREFEEQEPDMGYMLDGNYLGSWQWS